MYKKKLIYIVGGIIAFVMVLCFNLSFSQDKRIFIVENTEALAEEEFDLLKLCTKAGGCCYFSNTQNYNGIQLADD